VESPEARAMNPQDPRENAAPKRHVTVLESVEEIRSLARGGATVRDAMSSTVAINPSVGELAATNSFRPLDRPSMALLTVIDDGDDSGEKVRIRASAFVIGRVDGDLVIPHDVGISGRHVEISRRFEAGHHRWYLRDLQSTNGTFVRASSVILNPDQEVLIGRARFKFEPAGALPDDAGTAGATRKWQAVSSQEIAAITSPSLVEMTAAGEGRRFRLAEPEVWIGRDPKQCAIVLEDQTVDPRHARAYRSDRRRWMLENSRSLNGLWVRVQEIPLERGGQFQCGEQRFLIKIL
jgi:pSer/pThr/pTyr-binding forkhead associated (FHA) protein